MIELKHAETAKEMNEEDRRRKRKTGREKRGMRLTKIRGRIGLKEKDNYMLNEAANLIQNYILHNSLTSILSFIHRQLIVFVSYIIIQRYEIVTFTDSSVIYKNLVIIYK